MNLENLNIWGQIKGIKVLSATDFTHPLWFSELQEKLEPAENGLYSLKKEYLRGEDREVPESCRSDIRFILTTELSCIYSKGGRVRKVHAIIFAPSLEVVEKLNRRLTTIGNLRSDGRPILGLDTKELLKISLDASPECALIPAHAWTPHFSVFGSNSGFDSLEECFEELTPHIFAIESGLSSEPEMNWRLSALDHITIISNSDSHSLQKIGRECNVFETELSYDGVMRVMKKEKTDAANRLLMTIEFFPEEGKYHFDGHRNCGVRLAPQETKKLKNLCSVCHRPLTIGVMHRVDNLADREEGFKLKNAPPFKRVVPLQEIIGEAFDQGDQSAGVQSEYRKLVSYFGPELKILLKVPIEELKRFTHPRVAEGIKRMREDKVFIEPGFDGEYGKVHIFQEMEKEQENIQQVLF